MSDYMNPRYAIRSGWQRNHIQVIFRPDDGQEQIIAGCHAQEMYVSDLGRRIEVNLVDSDHDLWFGTFDNMRQAIEAVIWQHEAFEHFPQQEIPRLPENEA